MKLILSLFASSMLMASCGIEGDDASNSKSGKTQSQSNGAQVNDSTHLLATANLQRRSGSAAAQSVHDSMVKLCESTPEVLAERKLGNTDTYFTVCMNELAARYGQPERKGGLNDPFNLPAVSSTYTYDAASPATPARTVIVRDTATRPVAQNPRDLCLGAPGHRDGFWEGCGDYGEVERPDANEGLSVENWQNTDAYADDDAEASESMRSDTGSSDSDAQDYYAYELSWSSLEVSIGTSAGSSESYEIDTQHAWLPWAPPSPPIPEVFHQPGIEFCMRAYSPYCSYMRGMPSLSQPEPTRQNGVY